MENLFKEYASKFKSLVRKYGVDESFDDDFDLYEALAFRPKRTVARVTQDGTVQGYSPNRSSDQAFGNRYTRDTTDDDDGVEPENDPSTVFRSKLTKVPTVRPSPDMLRKFDDPAYANDPKVQALKQKYLDYMDYKQRLDKERKAFNYSFKRQRALDRAQSLIQDAEHQDLIDKIIDVLEKYPEDSAERAYLISQANLLKGKDKLSNKEQDLLLEYNLLQTALTELSDDELNSVLDARKVNRDKLSAKDQKLREIFQDSIAKFLKDPSDDYYRDLDKVRKGGDYNLLGMVSNLTRLDPEKLKNFHDAYRREILDTISINGFIGYFQEKRGFGRDARYDFVPKIIDRFPEGYTFDWVVLPMSDATNGLSKGLFEHKEIGDFFIKIFQGKGERAYVMTHAVVFMELIKEASRKGVFFNVMVDLGKSGLTTKSRDYEIWLRTHKATPAELRKMGIDPKDEYAIEEHNFNTYLKSINTSNTEFNDIKDEVRQINARIKGGTDNYLFLRLNFRDSDPRKGTTLNKFKELFASMSAGRQAQQRVNAKYGKVIRSGQATVDAGKAKGMSDKDLATAMLFDGGLGADRKDLEFNALIDKYFQRVPDSDSRKEEYLDWHAGLGDDETVLVDTFLREFFGKNAFRLLPVFTRDVNLDRKNQGLPPLVVKYQKDFIDGYRQMYRKSFRDFMSEVMDPDFIQVLKQNLVDADDTENYSPRYQLVGQRRIRLSNAERNVLVKLSRY